MQFATSLCAPCCRLQWLNDQSMDPGNLLHGQIDLGRLATAGHSRGGKIAALAYTREPRGPPPSPPLARPSTLRLARALYCQRQWSGPRFEARLLVARRKAFLFLSARQYSTVLPGWLPFLPLPNAEVAMAALPPQAVQVLS